MEIKNVCPLCGETVPSVHQKVQTNQKQIDLEGQKYFIEQKLEYIDRLISSKEKLSLNIKSTISKKEI